MSGMISPLYTGMAAPANKARLVSPSNVHKARDKPAQVTHKARRKAKRRKIALGAFAANPVLWSGGKAPISNADRAAYRFAAVYPAIAPNPEESAAYRAAYRELCSQGEAAIASVIDLFARIAAESPHKVIIKAQTGKVAGDTLALVAMRQIVSGLQGLVARFPTE